ncbi:MAG: right-handed parallel beta-helix repeat-containing protein, partial [Bacteroidota bacterium]
MRVNRRGTNRAVSLTNQLLLVFALFFGTGSHSALYASSFHVTVGGTAQGNGSLADPWDLQTALNQPTAVHPGDTIWVHGGVYHGAYTARLQGRASLPIIVRNYQRDHAAIEGEINPPEGIAFLCGMPCSYTWFWGLEFRGVPVNRSYASSSPAANILFGSGICTAQVNQALPGLKIVNCVIHDFVNGFGFCKEASGGEIYGNIIYNNGYDAPDRGHGHGIYVMNQTGRKLIADNILFNGYANGIQAYGSEAQYADNMTLAGNIIFNAGSSSQTGGGWNLIVGTMGTRKAVGDSVVGNYIFRGPNSGNFGGTSIGWVAGQESATVTDNWFVGSSSGEIALQLVNCSNLQLRNNRMIGTLTGFSSSTYPQNIYAPSAPTSGDTSIVRPNKYDATRANVVVYNWGRGDSVRLNLRGFASPGDSVVLYHAQNFYGDQPFPTVVSADGSIRIPMLSNRWTVSAPVAGNSPNSTLPGFGAFVLELSHTSLLSPPTLISPNPNSGHLIGAV